MAPLIALVASCIGFHALGLAGVAAFDSWQAPIQAALSIMFIVTGLAHFVQPKRGALIAMVPPRLPAPGPLVTVTGVLELAGAIALWIPALAQLAAAALAVLMMVMFPANVSGALRGLRFGDRPITPLWQRIPMQVVFVAAAIAAAV